MVLEQPAPIERHPLRAASRPDPAPGPHEVLVDVDACAVCRTDLQLVEGDLAARRLPIVPGHQVVGRVSAVGRAVTERTVGELVGLAWIGSACGTCRFCRSARENLCPSAMFTGWDLDGGFGDQVVARADYVHPLGDTAADHVALAPLLCGGAISYRCLQVAGVQPGQRLGLYGFGASASIVIQIARHWGCDVSVATRSATERQRALSMGAAWAGAYDERPPVPLDCAITFAPAGDVVVEALKSVDRGGTVAVNAIHLDRIPTFSYDLLWWERSIRSVANVTRSDVTALLELATEVPLTTTFEEYDLDDANGALEDLRAGRVRTAAVLRP